MTADGTYDWDAALKLKQDLCDKILCVLMEKGKPITDYSKGKAKKKLEGILKGYPQELLRKLDEFLASADEQQDSSNGAKAISRILMDEAPAESVSEAIYFIPQLDRPNGLIINSELPSVMYRALPSLHLYKQLPPSSDYSLEDAATILKCTALLHVASSLMELYWAGYLDLDLDAVFNEDWTIANEQLVELVLTNPERGEEIGDFFRKREQFSVGLIQEMLKADTKPLSGGVL